MPKITEEELNELKSYAAKIKDKADKGGKFEVIIHKQSKSNLTWRYSVRLWYSDESGKTEHWHLNWFLSQMSNQKLTKEGYLTGYGIGTERGFEVIYNLGLTLAKVLELDQSEKFCGSFGYMFTHRVLTTW